LNTQEKLDHAGVVGNSANNSNNRIFLYDIRSQERDNRDPYDRTRYAVLISRESKIVAKHFLCANKFFLKE
jgi:hypothetical protein